MLCRGAIELLFPSNCLHRTHPQLIVVGSDDDLGRSSFLGNDEVFYILVLINRYIRG